MLPGEKPKTPKQQHQAEFGSPGNYFAEKTIGAVTAGGRARAVKYARTLAAVEKKYGVPGEIVLAIWGRELGFGAAKMPYDAFEVLGTKAFHVDTQGYVPQGSSGRPVVLERGLATRDAMKSSWAGALGQPQFLPTSFLEHAVDFDGDGRADIWRSVPDVLASIANYLVHYGWIRGRDWGFEVNVPDGVSCALEGPDQGTEDRRMDGKMGIARTSGRPFPPGETRAEGFLLMPAGRSGPAFIATPNFYVLKEYNESDLYALFIGHAADRIAGRGPHLRGAMGQGRRTIPFRHCRHAARAGGEGYDVGGADGLPGFKTRRSIGDWQAKNGHAATCFPDRAVVEAMR